MAQVERQREERSRGRGDGGKRGHSKRPNASTGYELSGEAGMCVLALAIAFANKGGALRIGYTRDGGALALGCYIGDDYGTEYIRPSEDILHAVTEIAEGWLPTGADALQYGFNAISPPQR